MSVVVAAKPSHPALLPPTPPMTPPTSPQQTTLALPTKHGAYATIPKSPLGAKSPIVNKFTLNPATPVSARSVAVASAGTTATGPVAVAVATNQSQAPLACYSMLREFHATSIRYVIAKLRWDQTHSGYIPGCDPWDKINIVIGKLEDELAGVESAQKTLDKYPNLSHPIAPHGPALIKSQTYGPLTSEQVDLEIEKNRVRELALDKQLFDQFPFLKQAFVGPKTKGQAMGHLEMRKIIFDGEFYMDDLEEMMPEENLKAAMEGLSIDPYRKKPSPSPSPPAAVGGGGGGAGGGKRMRKMTYDEIRLEKETAKIAAQMKAAGIDPPPPPPPAHSKKRQGEGPMTKDEWIATLPVYGPKTKGETMLPVQREQRQIILTWLKQPWGVYDQEAAGLMHKLGTLAFGRLEEKAREVKGAHGGGGGGGKKQKEKDPKEAAAVGDTKKGDDEKDGGGRKEIAEDNKKVGVEGGEDGDDDGDGDQVESGEKGDQAKEQVEGDPDTVPPIQPVPAQLKIDAEAEPEAGHGATVDDANPTKAKEGVRDETELKLEVEILEGVEIVDLGEKVKLD